MRGYPVKFRKEGKYLFVSFPDIPEAFTQGRDRAEALKAARDVLETAMDVLLRGAPPRSSAVKAQEGSGSCGIAAERCGKGAFAERDAAP